MTVADIERIGSPRISRADARKAFLEYRRAVLAESDQERRKEYDGLMRGYKAIAQGCQVLDLQQAMHVASIQDDTGYPRLAIARADHKWCRVSMSQNGSAAFYAVDTAGDIRQWPRAGSRVTRLPAGTFPSIAWQPHPSQKYTRGRVLPNGVMRWSWDTGAAALVPLVPPQYHPKAALHNYHIVWDAVWQPAPPVDPLLVKHLAGMLYAIVAQWDLTPLERAVLRGRLTS